MVDWEEISLKASDTIILQREDEKLKNNHEKLITPLKNGRHKIIGKNGKRKLNTAEQE